jgi:hypothetical protein
VSLEVVAAEILIHRAILEHAWESTTFTATFDILHGVSFSNTCSGFIGGSQIGYNRQVSPYSRSAYVRGGRHQFERRDTVVVDGAALSANSKVNWIRTLAAHFGWAANYWQFYGNFDFPGSKLAHAKRGGSLLSPNFDTICPHRYMIVT